MKSLVRFSVWALVVSGVASGVTSADEVTDWNQVMLLAALTAPVTPAPVTTRVAAIVQAAVFDAVNGINRRYTPIYVPPAAAPGTSKRAAAVQAAYATLVHLFPNQKATFDQQRAASLAAITDTNDAVQQGLSWGQNVADQIWAWRSQDGFSDAPPPYLGELNPANGGQLRRPWRLDWCRSWRPPLPGSSARLRNSAPRVR